LPVYEYRCDICGHTFEVFQKFSDEPVAECERCGGTVSKVFHPITIHFKGSGFYTTDYGRSSSFGSKREGEGGDGKVAESAAGESVTPKSSEAGKGNGSGDRSSAKEKPS
jgi:putative FmdB family regulatory protein